MGSQVNLEDEAPGRPLVQLAGISKQYQDVSDGHPVLRDVTLSVQGGESLAIVGPSGSGKSTLLNIIGTLDQPTSGSVQLDGIDLSTRNEDELAALRNRQIGFVFQTHHLLPQCTSLENVLIPTIVLKNPARRQAARLRARQLLEHVGLGDRLEHRPGQLSGGERQRVAVVRAMINEPILLLADEPTGSLDEERAVEIGQLLADLNREEGVTLIVVSHDATLAGQMRRKLLLRDGQLHEQGGN